MAEELPAASDAPPAKRPCWENAKPVAFLDGKAASIAPSKPPVQASTQPTPSTQSQPQTLGNVRPASTVDDMALSGTGARASESPAKPAESVQAGGDFGRIRGLGSIPASWGKLPANASMAAEIAWVQANRLAVVSETSSGGSVVSLRRARSPAPSMAALSWLETSIRSYAKWVEVAARASGTEADDQQQAKRERARIEDIRAVLAEMIQELDEKRRG